MNPLLEVLKRAHGDDGPKTARPLHEAQILTLRELFAGYGTNPFKPGDLVTPRPGMPPQQPGEPHIVLEVRVRPLPNFNVSQPGHGAHGCMLDMRVLNLHSDNDVYSPHWVESWMFEPYVEKADQP